MVFTKKRNYILRLNITLSAKIALPAIKATAKIIGRLIVAPAIPVDIPISIDRPKVKTITMKAYQPGKVPYRTVAMQQYKHVHRAGSLSGKTDTGLYCFP